MKSKMVKMVARMFVVALVGMSLMAMMGANKYQATNSNQEIVSSGSECQVAGAYKCTDDGMIYKCISKQWQPETMCFFGCKDDTQCLMKVSDATER
jgi:hypothetical protein